MSAILFLEKTFSKQKVENPGFEPGRPEPIHDSSAYHAGPAKYEHGSAHSVQAVHAFVIGEVVPVAPIAHAQNPSLV